MNLLSAITSRLTWLMFIALFPFLLGATVINIGENNTVITGGITGADCVKGNGAIKTEKRSIETVSEVEVDGAFEVNIICGEKTGVQVTADSNLLPLIGTTVEGQRLTIAAKESYCTTSPLNIDVFLTTLQYLAADGSSDLTLKCSTHTVADLEIALDGSVNLNAAGNATNLKLAVDGSSEFNGIELDAQKVTVTAGGSSEVQVSASETISGTSRGASDVVFYGSPKSVKVSAEDASDFAPAD